MPAGTKFNLGLPASRTSQAHHSILTIGIYRRDVIRVYNGVDRLSIHLEIYILDPRSVATADIGQNINNGQATNTAFASATYAGVGPITTPFRW